MTKSKSGNVNGYAAFVAQEWEEINKTRTEPVSQDKFISISKRLARKWNKMSSALKQKFKKSEPRANESETRKPEIWSEEQSVIQSQPEIEPATEITTEIATEIVEIDSAIDQIDSRYEQPISESEQNNQLTEQSGANEQIATEIATEIAEIDPAIATEIEVKAQIEEECAVGVAPESSELSDLIGRSNVESKLAINKDKIEDLASDVAEDTPNDTADDTSEYNAADASEEAVVDAAEDTVENTAEDVKKDAAVEDIVDDAAVDSAEDFVKNTEGENVDDDNILENIDDDIVNADVAEMNEDKAYEFDTNFDINENIVQNEKPELADEIRLTEINKSENELKIESAQPEKSNTIISGWPDYNIQYKNLN